MIGLVGLPRLARADFDVVILAGTGLTNVTAGPTHSASGTPATIGADELITSLTTSGSAELNTGVGGPEPGDITSAGISITGTVGLGAAGTLTLDAARNIDFGTGDILLDSTTAFAPGIILNAGGSIDLSAANNITTTNIDTRSVTGNGGSLTIVDATSGGILHRQRRIND